MRVVVDCNVVVSAARTYGACRAVIDRVVRQHEIVLSEPVLREYEIVAERPKHALYRAALRANIAELERLAIFVEPATLVFRLRDPDDEIYLATAAAGGAGTDYGKQPGFHGASLWIDRGFFAALFPGARDVTYRAAVLGENAEVRTWWRVSANMRVGVKVRGAVELSTSAWEGFLVSRVVGRLDVETTPLAPPTGGPAQQRPRRSGLGQSASGCIRIAFVLVPPQGPQLSNDPPLKDGTRLQLAVAGSTVLRARLTVGFFQVQPGRETLPAVDGKTTHRQVRVALAGGLPAQEPGCGTRTCRKSPLKWPNPAEPKIVKSFV